MRQRQIIGALQMLCGLGLWAAKGVLVATHTWWLGLAVGVGSNWLATYGGNKRQRYEALRRVVVELERRVGVRTSIINRPSALTRN